MFEKNPQLNLPKKNEKVWRYMDFTKYVSMLSKQALFFCRIDKLGDKNEMSSPNANTLENTQVYEANKERFDFSLEEWNSLEQSMANQILINAWHRNIYESAAMWGMYLRTSEGLAVQSTIRNLCESFRIAEDEVNIGVVKYLNYEVQKIEPASLLTFATHKRKNYEYEKELRAIITKQSDHNNLPLHEVGKYVPVDISILVKKLYVAPNSQP